MGYRKVNQDVFDLVKTLLQAGVKKSQIKTITSLGMATVDNISKADDLEDYTRIVREQFAKKAAYDMARAQREYCQTASTEELVREPKEPVFTIKAVKKPYTVTMVINVDEDHHDMVPPLTALVNSMFSPDNVAVEVNGDN